MPKTPKEPPRRRKSYTNEEMHQAILAVRGGESIAGAARRFGVPRVTLMDKLSGRTPEICKMGRKPVLGEEEEAILVRWILQCRSAGFPVTTDQLIQSTKQMLQKTGKENVFSDGVPTKRWVEGFLKRNAQLSLRECQNLGSTRANVTLENIEQWYKEVRQYLEINELLDILKDPSRVYNCDETAFFLCPDKGKVIVGRGDKSVYRVSGNNEKENVTVLLNCCADGSLAPSMLVFSYDRWPPKVIASIPDEWGAGKTDNGWMTAESFYEYIANVFDPYLQEKNIKRPVILYMDGHTSHMSLEVSKLCSAKKIILVALFPNATHILQPLDVAVFHGLKVAWRRAVTNWRFENGGRKLKNEDFAPLVKAVLDSGAVKPETIKNGFKSCGLLSLDPKKANLTKILGESSARKPTANSANLLTLQRHLFFLESRIDAETLTSFADEENVRIEDRSLFLLWKNLQTEVAELKKQPQQSREEPNETTANEIINPSEAVVEVPVEDLSGSNQAVGDGGILLFEEPTILVTVPHDPNPTGDCSSPIIFDDHFGDMTMDHEVAIQESSVNLDSAIEIFKPSCSWDIPLWVSEDKSFSNEIRESPEISSTPSSKGVVEIETPSRGMPAEDQPPDMFENITPATPSDNNSSGAPSDIPSPFKNCLLWPEKKKDATSSKRKKIRTPSVVTSKLWKEYHTKIKEEKTKKEQEAADRKAKREEKIKIKQELTEEKIKRKLLETEKPSMKKSKTDKMNEEDEECEENENKFDLEKCCQRPRLPDLFKIGFWVVVPYTKKKGGVEKFIGQILAVNQEEASVDVKFLMKRGNKFVWPTQDDTDTVPLQDIITTLDEPLFDRRGYLTFSDTFE